MNWHIVEQDNAPNFEYMIYYAPMVVHHGAVIDLDQLSTYESPAEESPRRWTFVTTKPDTNELLFQVVSMAYHETGWDTERSYEMALEKYLGNEAIVLREIVVADDFIDVEEWDGDWSVFDEVS